MKIADYLNDGAGHQAKGVLAYLQPFAQIESSWNTEQKRYTAEVEIARWENCREQGYVVSLRSANYKRCLHIIFFEHRNSDSICAVKWEQTGLINSPTIDTAKFGKVYKDKYDTSYQVSCGEVVKMADWIITQLNEFWQESGTEAQIKKEM